MGGASQVYPFVFPVIFLSELTPDILRRVDADEIGTENGSTPPDKYYPNMKAYDAAGKLYRADSFLKKSEQPRGFLQRLFGRGAQPSLQIHFTAMGPYQFMDLRNTLAQRLQRDREYWQDRFEWDVAAECAAILNSSDFEELTNRFEA